MNSLNEWTVFRETMCFYGVVQRGGNVAAGATILAGLLPIRVDRLIGV